MSPECECNVHVMHFLSIMVFYGKTLNMKLGVLVHILGPSACLYIVCFINKEHIKFGPPISLS